MSDEFKNIIKVACIYATTVIGAGFASGQEIMRFFSIYKTGGFYGILSAGLLFSLIGCIMLERVYSERIRNYEEYLFPTFGWTIGWILEITVTLFMLFFFCIMIAGAANVLTDMLDISFNYAAVIMGLLCMALIFSNIKGIVAFSTFITPVLIIGILLVGLYIIFFGDREVFGISGLITNMTGINMTGNWFFSSLLYVSYNNVLAIVIMCSLLPYLKTARTARIGGVLGGALLCLSALVIHAVILMFYHDVFEKELPILFILKSFSSFMTHFYAVILWIAMLTSAVTSGFCFTDRIKSMLKVDRKMIIPILCAASIPLSTLGFSKLVASVYPIFGYIGLFLVFVILMQGIISFQNKFQNRATNKYGRK